MDTYNTTYKYSHFIEETEDTCNECSEIKIQDSCNKCGEGVCLRASCCQTFPHYNKNIYIICNRCIIDIEKKLKPTSSVDQHDLRLLKKKINNRMNRKIEKLEERIEA
jgi:hypothetical protein